MATEKQITCPSGLEIVVREMTGTEVQSILSARGEADDGALLLQQCVVRVIKPGELYNWGENVFIVDDLIQGDVTMAMIEIRVATFGPEFDLHIHCPKCGHENDYTVDLGALPVKKMDPEGIKRLRTNDPFVTSVRGTKVKWLPATRRQRKQVSALQKVDPDKRYALAANLRIVEIDGVHDNDRLEWLEKMGAGTLGNFIAAMDYFDGGVELEQTFRCGGCPITLRGEIPLDRQLFEPPKKKWQKAGTRPDVTSIG